MNKLIKICLSLSLVLLSGCQKKNDDHIDEDINQSDDTIVEPVKETITLSFVGDVTLGNYVGQGYSGSFNEEYQKQNASYFFKNVSSIFENDDLTIVNLEGPLTNQSAYKEKTYSMCGLPEYVDILTQGSVEIVSLANNHSSDRLQEGLDDTRSILSDNNIGHFGYSYTHIEEVKGIKIGFAGIYFPYSYNDEMDQIITQLNEDADIVVVYFHWGTEGDRTPSSTQRSIAKTCIDHGVDIVVGAHPHVLQKTETYKGKKIIYSLGNFCFGGNKNPKDQDTVIYQYTFELEDKQIVSESYNYIPCLISSSSSRNNYQPTLAQCDDVDRILNKLEELE